VGFDSEGSGRYGMRAVGGASDGGTGVVGNRGNNDNSGSGSGKSQGKKRLGGRVLVLCKILYRIPIRWECSRPAHHEGNYISSKIWNVMPNGKPIFLGRLS